MADRLVSISMQQAEHAASGEDFKFNFRKLLRFMGPGLLMSVAYVDPGNLEADLQVGASTGYVLLWLMLISTCAGFLVQMQAAKLGVATGMHLAEHCREEYSPVPRYLLWIMAEIAIIGSDIQEVIGSSIALSLLSSGAIPLWAGVLTAAALSFIMLFLERLGVRYLELCFALLIGTMCTTFGVMYTQADVPTWEVVKGFTRPYLPMSAISQATALAGALIMPHNIYLHSALVQTRRLETNAHVHKKEALVYYGIESALALLASVVINMFVISVFAAGFFHTTHLDIGLQNAGQYLQATYGKQVALVWALGLLAAGQSSTMTGTYTGQFVMSGYLDMRVSPWLRVMITRSVAIVPTLAVALLYEDSKRLDQLNQLLNIVQSLQLPFALIPVLTLCASPRIMGRMVNGLLTNLAVSLISLLVVAINLSTVAAALQDVISASLYLAVLCLLAVALYLAFVGYLAWVPLSKLGVFQAWGLGWAGPSAPPSRHGSKEGSIVGAPAGPEGDRDESKRREDGLVGADGEAGLREPLLRAQQNGEAEMAVEMGQ